MRFAIPLLGMTAILLAGHGIGRNMQRPDSPAKITEAEIKTAINSQSGVDECERLDDIHIDHLEYFDLTGDGQDEAVVVASTCMTGTAGPDIHAVYKRDVDGKVVELPFLDARGDRPFPIERFPSSAIQTMGSLWKTANSWPAGVILQTAKLH